jgi:tetratricopeptide (TPR) repeat protein
MGNKRGIAYCSGNIGITYRDLGNYQKAFNYMNRALTISNELGDQRSASLAYGNIGTLFKLQKRFKKAEQYYTKAIALERELQLFPFLCKFLHEKAELHFMRKENEKSMSLNEEAMQIAENVGRNDIIERGLLLDAKILSTSDKQAAIRQMQELLGKARDKHYLAMIHEELFHLTRKQEHRAKAKALYSDLFKSTGKRVFSKKRDALKGGK